MLSRADGLPIGTFAILRDKDRVKGSSPAELLVSGHGEREIGHGIRAEAQEFLQRVGLASRPITIGEYGQCSGWRAPDTRNAVDEEPSGIVFSTEGKYLPGMLARRQRDTRWPMVEVFEAQHKVIWGWAGMEPQPLPARSARRLQAKYAIELALLVLRGAE